MLEPHALEDPHVSDLITVSPPRHIKCGNSVPVFCFVNFLLWQTLLQWLNDTLEGRRIVVRDIVEDLYDGQILGELLGM